MRILIHGINFFPELTGIGKYSGEMAEWLAAQGHEVRVVTAPPYYPYWRVGEGFSGWRYRREGCGAGLPRRLRLLAMTKRRGVASAMLPRNDGVVCHREAAGRGDLAGGNEVNSTGLPRRCAPRNDGQGWIAMSARLPRNDGVVCHREAAGRGDPAGGNEVNSTGLPRRCAPRNDGQGWIATPARPPRNDGMVVYRCPLWVPSKPSGLKRLLHLASFALSSFPIMMRQIFWRPDVVLVVEPPFFCAPQAWLVARLSGAKAWLHIQDFEIDAAFDLGILRLGWMKWWVLQAERFMMRRFDRVSTISQRMTDRALAKGVASERVVLFPNWADVKGLRNEDSGLRTQDSGSRESVPRTEDSGSRESVLRTEDSGLSGYRAELGIAADAVVALYSGNMGNKQGLEILAQAAKLCAVNPSPPPPLPHAGEGSGVVFVFCGNGAGRADLVAQCDGLPNVRFMDLQPLERLGELLAMADIHLLPQRADAADLVMPSKLTGMLASGRPVVATAHPGTEVAKVVNGKGIVVPPENPQLFADAIIDLAGCAETRRIFGAAARRYAEEHLDKDAVLASFERELVRLCGTT